jgi:hypothetical protein
VGQIHPTGVGQPAGQTTAAENGMKLAQVIDESLANRLPFRAF